MTFVTGSVTAIPGPPGVDLADKVEAALLAHPAWVKVETYVAAPVTWRVWKCLGTLNGNGVDFFLAVYTTTSSTGVFGLQLFEEYTVGTHSYKWAATTNTTGTNALWNPTSYANSGDATYALPAGGAGTGFANGVPSISTQATYDYWISVTNVGLTVATRHSGGTQGAIYAGAFDWWGTPTYANPLVQMILNDSTGGTANINATSPRTPGGPAAWVANQGSYWQPLNGTGWLINTGVQTQVGSGTTADYYRNGMGVVSPHALKSKASGYGIAGALRHIVDCTVAAGVAQGDTFDIGSDTYSLVCAASGVGLAVNTEAA